MPNLPDGKTELRDHRGCSVPLSAEADSTPEPTGCGFSSVPSYTQRPLAQLQDLLAASGTISPASSFGPVHPARGGISLPTSPRGSMAIRGGRNFNMTLPTALLNIDVLVISFVFHLCGFVMGFAVLLSGAIAAHVNSALLTQMCFESHLDSYAALFVCCAGPRAGRILDGLLFIWGNGCCVTYLVFISDFVPEVCKFLAPGLFLQNRVWAIIFAALLAAPFAVQADTAKLRFVQPISILGLLYVTVVICVQSAHLAGESLRADGVGGIEWFKPGLLDIPEGFAICCFAFNCHFNLAAAASTLVLPSASRTDSASKSVNMLHGLSYCIIGVAGYLSWLKQTTGDLLAAYPPDDVSITVARVMLTVTMTLAIPINLVPSVRSGLKLAGYLMAGGEADSEEPGPAGPRLVVALVCLVVQVMVAISVPKVTDVISLLGATVATALLLGIPAYCVGRVLDRSLRNRICVAVSYFLGLLGLASVPIKILRQAGVVAS